MPDISEVAENIYMIDNQLFNIPKWGCVYLLNEDYKTLIETGPTNSIPFVLAGIKKIGFKPKDVAHIIVTHIHLDHAGGTGVLAQAMPQAQVIVHHKGARHLVNPTRLVESAIAARGNEFINMHGKVLPIDIHRVKAVNEGDRIQLSDQQMLHFIDAPGHAPHELCIFETRNCGLFTGDAVAVYIPDYDVLLPFHPPPHFNLELCLDTLLRLEGLSARTIYYSHFGISSSVKEHIQRSREQLMVWDNIFRTGARDSDWNEIESKMTSQACAQLEPLKGIKSVELLYEYLADNHIPLCAAGHIKYYQELSNTKT
ncbi:MAG TPA: MBL fold metallo-hydrolase [Dehalococcoidia bacterium]|nr:MBL fold metallo-hydrolase [Dehalococcoidia bacterium]